MPTYKDHKTGRWYCKFVYEDWSGKKKQKKKMGFRLQKEAKEYEIEFIARHSKSCDMQFSLFIDVYLEDCKPRVRPTTLSGKQYLIREHILPYFGHLKLTEITAITVRNWQTELLNHPNNYKETYLKTIHNQLSAIMNFACRFYGLRENPAKQCGAMGKKQAEGILQQYINTLPNENAQERLFSVTKGGLTQEMNRGIEVSGVKRIRVHDLRHSHASLLVELGCSPVLISERLGHEDLKTTLQTYSHLYPNKQKEVIKSLENWCEKTLKN